MAIFPFSAISCSNLKLVSKIFMSDWLSAMSSTTNTLIGFVSFSCIAGNASGITSIAVFGLLKVSTKLKVEPSSILLFTLILPPCDSTNCFTIVRPMPVPPYNLDVPLDSCWKTSKIWANLFSAIPIPVSSTENWIDTSSISSRSNLTETLIFPLSVNFTALLTRFNIIWFKRTGSPINRSGMVLSYSLKSSRFFSLIFVPNKWSMVETEVASLKEVLSKVIFPASTLARSSKSSMSKTNSSLLVLIAVKYSFCFCDNSDRDSTLVNPMIAFIGVRISWLMFDKNCCLALMASSALLSAFSNLVFNAAASAVSCAINALAVANSIETRSASGFVFIISIYSFHQGNSRSMVNGYRI